MLREPGREGKAEAEREGEHLYRLIFCARPRANAGAVPQRLPSQLPPLTGFSSLLAAEDPAGVPEGSRLEEVGEPPHWLLRAGDAQGWAGLRPHRTRGRPAARSHPSHCGRVSTSQIFVSASGGPTAGAHDEQEEGLGCPLCMQDQLGKRMHSAPRTCGACWLPALPAPSSLNLFSRLWGLAPQNIGLYWRWLVLCVGIKRLLVTHRSGGAR